MNTKKDHIIHFLFQSSIETKQRQYCYVHLHVLTLPVTYYVDETGVEVNYKHNHLKSFV